MEGGPRRSVEGGPLEFDDIAFGVGEVDRWPFAFGAVTRPGLFDRDGMMREVGADGGLVERGDRDREKVDVATLAARRRAAHRAELAVAGDAIEQRTADAYLIAPDTGMRAIVGAAENITGKAGPIHKIAEH